MPDSSTFLVTLLGCALGLLLGGAIGALLGGVGFFLLLRVEKLNRRLHALEQAQKASSETTPASNTPP